MDECARTPPDSAGAFNAISIAMLIKSLHLRRANIPAGQPDIGKTVYTELSNQEIARRIPLRFTHSRKAGIHAKSKIRWMAMNAPNNPVLFADPIE